MHRLLLSGYDTIECAYYLAFGQGCLLNFEQLAAEKEALRQLKTRTSYDQIWCMTKGKKAV